MSGIMSRRTGIIGRITAVVGPIRCPGAGAPPAPRSRRRPPRSRPSGYKDRSYLTFPAPAFFVAPSSLRMMRHLLSVLLI